MWMNFHRRIVFTSVRYPPSQWRNHRWPIDFRWITFFSNRWRCPTAKRLMSHRHRRKPRINQLKIHSTLFNKSHERSLSSNMVTKNPTKPSPFCSIVERFRHSISCYRTCPKRSVIRSIAAKRSEDCFFFGLESNLFRCLRSNVYTRWKDDPSTVSMNSFVTVISPHSLWAIIWFSSFFRGDFHRFDHPPWNFLCRFGRVE